MKRWIYGLTTVLLIFLIVWLFPPGSIFVPDCELDGSFEDWQGRTFLSDVEGDGCSHNDFKKISWATNENESSLYFMIERFAAFSGKNRLDARMFFDINANGSYEDLVDKYVDLSYYPNNGQVNARIYTVDGRLKGTYSGQWGEISSAGGSRFEFSLPMDELRVYPAQTIRFYITDISGTQLGRLPDQGDIQWSPFPVYFQSRLSIGLACLIWLLLTVFFHHNRIWVFYYVWGSVGLCCLMILLFHGSLVEYRLEHYTSLILHHLLAYLDIMTYIFDKAPGTLLVLIKVDNSWTTIAIDIENSGFLEMCIVFGLIIFYPVYRWRKRIGAALLGVSGVYAINLLRLMVVICLIHKGGRDMSFIAHTLIGRLLFFTLVIALYWKLITKATLKKIKENVQND